MRTLGWLLAILLIAALGLLALLRWQPQLVPAAISASVPQAIVDAVHAEPGAAQQNGESPGEPADPAQGPKIYAWKDDQGRWNYTDTPPTDRPYETRQYREDVNVVPAYSPDPDG